MTEAELHQHEPPVPGQDLRKAIRISIFVCLSAALLLVGYASLVGIETNLRMADEIRHRMIVAAIVGSISLFPVTLFLIRLYHYSTKQGPYPSVPLSLLAAISTVPFVLSMALLFMV